MTFITVAIEDELSLAVVVKILATVRPGFSLGNYLGLRGKSYLKAKARALNTAAKNIPVLLLVDLDTERQCPRELVTDWLGNVPERKMIFRVAVHEIESWIMADRSAIAEFLSIPESRIPQDCDGTPQTKEFLVGLARRSRSTSIRKDLVPAVESSASVGPNYNLRLTEFVQKKWRPLLATRHSK